MDLDALIQRAKANDQSAFDVLYRTYHPKMVRVCANIIKEDRDVVEDLVHDAFVMAFVSIGSLKDNSKFNEWLTSIVRNVALKHIEQRDRARVLPISDVEDDVLSGTSSPDSDLIHKELLGLIDRLPEGYRKIMRLYVVEGFSHKEIADMLGIEPHSSSSQLARARHLLRRMLLGFIAVLLVPLAWYLLLREEKEEHGEIVKIDVRDDVHTQNNRIVNDSVSEQYDAPKAVHSVMNFTIPEEEGNAVAHLMADSALSTDTASVVAGSEMNIADDVLIAETIADTLGADTAAVVRPIVLPEINIAEIDGRKKNRKWQLLAAGSLGPALVQNVYNLIAVNTSLLPEIDGVLGETPNYVSTWEEYCSYLKAVASSNASADTLRLIQIAEQNSGRIMHKEHHDKPITFGISLTKSVSDRLSVETGLQYSILKSRFTIGEGGDSAATRQKIHYIGLPLRVSYKWADYKRLSVYSSAGATLHVPVYGKVTGSDDNDWKRIIFGDKPLNPSLQWQVGGSVGLQYEFAPNTSVFVEPTVNWFIPSDSKTHTVWTEQPVMLTCPFGIRITW